MLKIKTMYDDNLKSVSYRVKLSTLAEIKEKKIKIKEFTLNGKLFYLLDYTLNSPRFDGVADECRSLIIDSEFNVVSRSFDRFYNFVDIEADPNLKDLLSFDSSKYLVEKIDGHLINIYFLEGEWRVSSRSIPLGDNVPVASLKSYRQLVYQILGDIMKSLNKNCTYICELVLPCTKVVTDYAENEYGLYLLAIRNNYRQDSPYSEILHRKNKYTSDDKPRLELVEVIKGFKYPKRYIYSPAVLESLLSDCENKETTPEGFVLYNADGKPLAKIKTQAYLEKHRELWVSQGLIWGRIFNRQDVSDYYFYGSKLMEQAFGDLERMFTGVEAQMYDLLADNGLTWDTVEQKDYAVNYVSKFEKKYHCFLFTYKKNPNRRYLTDEFQKCVLSKKIDFIKPILQKLKDEEGV